MVSALLDLLGKITEEPAEISGAPTVTANTISPFTPYGHFADSCARANHSAGTVAVTAQAYSSARQTYAGGSVTLGSSQTLGVPSWDYALHQVCVWNSFVVCV